MYNTNPVLGYVLLIVFSLCFNLSTSAQATSPLSNTLLPSSSVTDDRATNAASLYIGQPGIGIPIFYYKDEFVRFPISLSYDGTGTTVEKIGSEVGLGWSLNVPGHVRRVVIGTPDEFSYTLNGNLNQVGFLNTPANPSSPSRAQLDEYYNEKRDGEADIFQFDIPGYSGRIMIDKTNAVVGTIPASNLSISYTRTSTLGRINSFTIKTEEGLIYQFAEEEIVKFKTKIDNADYTFDYADSWLLTSIRLATQPTNGSYLVSFSYNSFTTTETIGKHTFSALPADPVIIGGLGSVCFSSGGNCCVGTFWYNTDDITREGTFKTLANISFPNGTSLGLSYNSGRCDLSNNSVFLSSISTSGDQENGNKKYNFEYAYSNGDGTELPVGPCDGNEMTKRFLLKKIIQVGKGGETLPAYSFDYVNNILLPRRNSDSVRIDKWGFLEDYQGVIKSKAFVLKRITYPTGGFKEYEFEPNVTGWTKAVNGNQNLNGLRIRKITTNEGLGAVNPADAIVERVYTYVDPETNVSTGEVDYLPISEFQTRLNLGKVNNCGILNSEYHNVIYRNRIKHSPISAFPVGNSCAYSVVVEEVRTPSKVLGRLAYYFKNFKDYTSSSVLAGIQGQMDFPFANKQYNIAWGLGLLYKTETYGSTGLMVKKEENIYDVTAERVINSNIASFKSGLLYGPVNRSTSNVNGDVFQYETYYPLTGRANLTKTIVTDYTYPINSSVAVQSVSETEFEYVSNSSLIRKSINYDSKDRKIESINYYPFDYSLSGAEYAPLNTLKQLNIKSVLVSTETWVTKANVKFLIGSMVQTFGSYPGGLIMPDKKFELKTAYPIAESQIPAFSATSLFRNLSLYREVERYDIRDGIGNITQQTSRNVSSTRIFHGYLKSTPVASFENATQAEVAYTSFEDIYIDPLYTTPPFGNFTLNYNNTPLLHNRGFTGKYSFSGAINATLKKGKYIVSTWATLGTPFIWFNQQIFMNYMESAKGWSRYEYEIEITNPNGDIFSVRSGSGGLIDEVMIYPVNSTPKTVTYNSSVEKVSEFDNRLYTHFEFDNFSRLRVARDADSNITKVINYVVNESSGVFKSRAITGVFTRNNCSTGYEAGSVGYTVPAGTFTSSISQSDADRKAEEDCQNYANQNGTCTLTRPIITSVSYPASKTFQVNFATFPNSTFIGIEWYDPQTGQSNNNIGSQISPRTITVPFSGRSYQLKLYTATTTNPVWVSSIVYNYYMPF